MDAEGAARERHACSSDRWSWPSSWRGRTASACELGQIPPLDLVQVRGRGRRPAREPHPRRSAAADGEDVLRRLIMDPSDGSFWHVRLEPVDEPTRRPALPDVEAAVAQAMNDRYDVARASNDVSNAARQRRVPLRTRSCPTCGSKRRIAAAASADRSCSGPGPFPARSSGAPQRRLRRRARPGADVRLPDVERRRDRQLSARAAATRR